MAELTINADEIAAALREHIGSFTTDISKAKVGRVLEVGDGIARVSGLPDTAVNELLEFEGGTLGLALNLDEDSIGAVILGVAEDVEEGNTVQETGRILSVPVGDALLGRVVNALGQPIDGKGPINTDTERRLEVQAPGIIGRQPVHEPLQTGIKAIDAMTPVGRGQRELIIGDRKTGKTTVAVDTILNQRGQNVKCIYVAIGQKSSTVAQTVATLDDFGAMEYTVVVNAPAGDGSVFKYLAPYAGCAMGQHWMDNGEAALVIYDDLSKQAEAYRQLALLLRRPPGREAYPGDVFYLHSRLLERAAKLSDERGAGSLTALPIIETKGGDVSAYIPTNVISITDGQIYLVDDLFKSGVRPAVDVGISVSRVGGDAQIKAMKSVAGTLKLDLAQFRDLEAFATFGSELDRVSQAQLDRGYRLTELLKQPLNAPMPVEVQVVSIFVGTSGALDDIPVEDVKRFERDMLDFFQTRYSNLLTEIRDTGKLPDEAALERRRGRLQGDVRALGRRARHGRGTRGRAPGRSRVRQDAGDGVARRGGWSGAHPPAADQVGPVDEEDHARHGADRGEPDRQGAGPGRRSGAVQRADHRGRRRPRRRPAVRCRARCSSPRRDPHRRTRRHHRRPRPRWRVQLVGAARRRGRDEGACASSGGRTLRSSSVARARATSATATYAMAGTFTGFSDQPTYEDARAIAAAVREPFLDGEVDLVQLIYTRFISVGSQEVVVRPLMPLDRETLAGGDGLPDPGDDGDGLACRVRVRARTRGDPRAPAAALRRGPHLRRAARTRPRPSTRRGNGR